MVLLSGGIDSPVAAWRLIRRGCRAAFVHFHSYPILSRTSQEKARDLVRILTQHQLRSRLYLVPFGPIQQQIVVTVPPAMRVVVYRRLMMRIAERLAVSAGAQALVTGDSLGQVASQTIPNLAAVGEVATMPILRPLIGLIRRDRGRAADRHVRDVDHSRRGLLHAVHAAVSDDRRAARPGAAGGNRSRCVCPRGARDHRYVSRRLQLSGGVPEGRAGPGKPGDKLGCFDRAHYSRRRLR